MVTLKRLFTGFFTASRFRMTGYFRMAGGFGGLFTGDRKGRPYVVRKNSRRFISRFRRKFHSAPYFFLPDSNPLRWALNR